MRKFLAIAAIVLLTSCGQGDIENFVISTQNSKGVVEPLPVLKKITYYQYSANLQRSPFGDLSAYSASEDLNTDMDNNALSQAGISEVIMLQNNPDGLRPKFYLEKFNLKSLKYVGTIKTSDYAWALIVDREGQLHHVRVGDYVGQNSGKVTQILDNKIVIRQLRPDKTGKWNEIYVDLNLVVKPKDSEQNNAKEQK